MSVQFGLADNVIKKIIDVLEKHLEVEEAIIYGSRAKGNFKNSSDIDITLKGNNINLNTLNQISFNLDELPLPYIFDVSIYNHITNTELLDHISRVGKVLYKTNTTTIL